MNDPTVRLVIEIDLDSEAMEEHGVKAKDVLDGIFIRDHDIIDGFEITTAIEAVDRTRDYLLCNGRIVSREMVF
jgi:hypothetical protein